VRRRVSHGRLIPIDRWGSTFPDSLTKRSCR
jgi:hypothetical protein